MVTGPFANGKTAALPGPDGPTEAAPAEPIDLAEETVPGHADDQVVPAGLQTDPSQDAHHPIVVPACAASCLVIILADVCPTKLMILTIFIKIP